jgi:GNAT superfamily N-acetyltransferase
LPSHETREFEANEANWWARWVDETVWVSKNGYVVFSDPFKESFFNRGGFLGVERVPEDAIEAMEKEFAKRGRPTPCILVEEGRPWDKMRAVLASRGYSVTDKMLVMEWADCRSSNDSSPQPTNKKSGRSNLLVEVTSVGPGPGKKGRRGKSSKKRNGGGSGGNRSLLLMQQQWTQTYLQAFYEDEKSSEEAVNKVTAVMKKVVRDKKASVFLARVGSKEEKEAVGCAVMYRSAGGLAGAYCIGTVPQFRGRGVAAAMLEHIRELAQEEGRRLVLQTMASDGAEGFYARQGFSLIYAKAVFERVARKPMEDSSSSGSAVPSGETFGVWINRGAAAGITKIPFVEVFSGFENVGAVRRLFGPDTERIISNLKISLDSPRGYLRVDGETGNIIINPDYLKSGDEKHLYLDVIHELTHVKQFREGKELYDRSYAYFERPTEIEAYRVAVEEARVIGMDRDEIVEYLRVEWVTEEEFLRFVLMMRLDES